MKLIPSFFTIAIAVLFLLPATAQSQNDMQIAIHLAPWEMTGQLPDGTKIEQSGLSIAVLKQQANGEWLMIFDNPHGQFLMNK